MPGTPPTTARLNIPRFATTDPDQVPTDLNAVSDQVDTLAARIDSGLSSAPPAAGIQNRFWRETDTGLLKVDTGTTIAHITPGPHASRHQDGGADPVTVREAMMATGALGMAKGSFSAYRNAAQALVTTARVDFDTEEWDVSDWLSAGIFTPQIAGYYHFSWLVSVSTAMTVDNYIMARLYKNGAAHRSGSTMNYRTAVAAVTSVGNARAKANGTTDFFDIRLIHNQGTPGSTTLALFTGAADSHFSGELIGRS